MVESPAEELLSLLDRLAPAGVCAGTRSLAHGQPALWPEEELATGAMNAQRRQEFSAGRAAARDALARLGRGPAAIPITASRAPAWPAGIVGSITHTSTLAAAVVAAAAGVRSLGLDSEASAGLDAELLAMVCGPEEQRRLPAASSEAALEGKLLFSAKEAAYKCLWPLYHRFLEFHDLDITLERSTGTFRVAAGGTPARGMQLGAIRGRYAAGHGVLVTLCWVDAGSGTPR